VATDIRVGQFTKCVFWVQESMAEQVKLSTLAEKTFSLINLSLGSWGSCRRV